MGDVLVECHSGFTYAQRPVALNWQGERLEIERVVAEWQVPDGKRFRVVTHDGRVFELFYRTENDEWQVVPA